MTSGGPIGGSIPPPLAAGVATPNPNAAQPTLTINDLANLIKANSDSVVGKMTDMEGRLARKIDAQDTKIARATDELKSLRRR